MNKFLTVSSLMLFWAFFEMSGGMDFVPASEQAQEDEVIVTATADRFKFTDVYVPFSAPVVTTTLPVVATAPAESEAVSAPTDIVQVAFSDTSNETKDGSTIRTTAKTDLSEPRADIRIVAGNRVNMREGPSTGFAVVNTLTRGIEAEVLRVNDENWAQIRLLETGETGWMAAWLLSD